MLSMAISGPAKEELQVKKVGAKSNQNLEFGGEFTIFYGLVIGKNLELQEGKLIVQKMAIWELARWIYSAVTFL